MWIKVDISTKNKDAYSIYYKKWFFCRWTRIDKDYEDTISAMREAYALKEGGCLPPIYKGFLLKLDFSKIPGCYTVYARKSIFHKWEAVSTSRDIKTASWELSRYKRNKFPIYI